MPLTIVGEDNNLFNHSIAQVYKPPGTAEGDLILIFFMNYPTNVPKTPPSGWTNLGVGVPNSDSSVWWKIATASEPSNYDFQYWDGSQYRNSAGYSVAIRGASRYKPFVDDKETGSASGTSHVYNSVNMDAGAAFLLYAFARWGGSSTGSLTQPGSMTQESYMTAIDAFPHNISSEARGAGETGTRTFTGSSGAITSNYLMFGVKDNATPGVPTGLQRTGDKSDTTPTFSAVAVDVDTGQQRKVRFELYQNDGTTLIGTVDSAYVTSSTTVTAEYTSALAVGTYKVKAKTIDVDGAQSAYTSLLTFEVTQVATEDTTLLWTVNEQTNINLTLQWSVDNNNSKQLTALWDVLVTITDDLRLLWDVATPWSRVDDDVPDTAWTRVGEL